MPWMWSYHNDRKTKSTKNDSKTSKIRRGCPEIGAQETKNPAR